MYIFYESRVSSKHCVFVCKNIAKQQVHSLMYVQDIVEYTVGHKVCLAYVVCVCDMSLMFLGP